MTEGPKKPLCNFERVPSNFLEIHPVELGRQLALMEFKMFKRITPLELLRQVSIYTNAHTSKQTDIHSQAQFFLINFNSLFFGSFFVS